MSEIDIEYIGAYQIQRQLGAGAFGVVYQAYQPFLDRQVAIKTLRTDTPAHPQNREQFIREARTIARLRHTGIITVYEFGEIPYREDRLTYMVMEYLTGETLEKALSRGRFSPEIVVTIVRQIASAIDYAHASGVIHRDLKPANIIFSREDQPVIVDFGLARLMELGGYSPHPVTGTPESNFSGTPAYMAPEQMRTGRANAHSDLYTLALMTYEMLAGELPFAASTMSEMITSRLSTPLPLLCETVPELPAAVDRVMMKALAHNPLQRYQTASDFAAALASVLLPEPELLPVTEARRPVVEPEYHDLFGGIVALVVLAVLSLVLRLVTRVLRLMFTATTI